MSSRWAQSCKLDLAKIQSRYSTRGKNCFAMSNANQPDISVAETTIEVNLSRLGQLFNSLDPSPFHERDLDQDAEDYIVGSAEEAPRQQSLRLVIHLPADQLPLTGAPDLATAVHHYFAYRESHERRRLRLLFRDGRIALITGLAFLLSCTLLRELAFSLGKRRDFRHHRRRHADCWLGCHVTPAGDFPVRMGPDPPPLPNPRKTSQYPRGR
jgi:hypothetical protein